MTTSLNSIASVKSFLNIRDTDTKHDTLVTLLSKAATEQIQDALSVKLELGTYTEFFNTRRSISKHHDLYGSSESGYVLSAGRQVFTLDSLAVQDTDFAVWYDPSMEFADTTQLEVTTDYHFDVDEGVLTLFAGTGDYTKSLKVSYTAGYAITDDTLEASAPANMVLAHLYQVAYNFKRHNRDNVGMTGDQAVASDQVVHRAGQWNTPQGLCREAVGLLAPYKKPLMGRG